MSKAKDSSTRSFGIEMVGDIQWGTHLCQFYQTKKDLVDILVPYFAEGLRNNEFCMWITSPPLEVAEARRALGKAVPDLDKYVEKGQIEILSYKDWYLLGGTFNADRVLQGWVTKEKRALDQGFEGLRLTGNTFWVERKDWKNFTDYEAMVNDVIGSHRMIALCTYSLKKCKGTDVVDVVRNHIGTLIRRGDAWCLVEDVAKRRMAEQDIRESEAKYRSLFDNMIDGFAYSKVLFDEHGKPIDYVLLEINEAFERFTGLEREKVIGKKITEVLPSIEKDLVDLIGVLGRVGVRGEPVRFENYSEHFRKWYLVSAFSAEEGYIAAIFEDITERRLAENALTKQRNTLQAIMENTGTMLAYLDAQFNFVAVNSAYARGSGRSGEDLVGKNHFAIFPSAENQAVFEKVRDTGQPVTFFDKPFEFADQHERGITYWDWTLAPVKDHGGRVEGLVLSLMETTERKKAEEEIRVLSRFPSENPNPVIRMSSDGKILYGNPASLPLLDNWKCQVGQFAPEEWRQRVADTYSSGTERELEDRIDNRVFSFLLVPIVNVGYVNVYGRDITEQKKAEEETLRAKNEWERTFDSIPDLIAIIDSEHRIVRANESMAQHLGLSVDQCAGLNCFRCIHKCDEPPSFCPHSLTLKDGKEHTEEIHEDNLGGDFLVSTTPMFDRQGRITGSVHVARDITQRKKTEEAFRVSAETARQRAEELEKLMDTVPNAVWVSRDSECRVITGNRAANRFYEAESGENVSAGPTIGGEQDQTRRFFQNGRELKPEELPMQVAAAQNTEVRNSELDVLLPSGKKITILGSAIPLLDAQGKVRGSIASFMDVTERKKAEEALRESQKDLNRAQAVAKTGSWRLDVRRNELLWSDETYRMFGIPRGAPMTYEAFLATIHPDDREYVDQKWKAALNGEPYDIEHRIIVGGEVKWVRERAELEFNKDRALLGGFGTVQDVTETRLMQDKLFQSEKKYRTLYETSIDGIVSTDMDGHITECNDAFSHMLGYSKDELKNMTYQQITPEKWRQADEMIVREQITKRGHSDLFEKEHIRKDGSVFPISIRVWLVRDEKWSPVGMWGIVRDITRSKQLEDELKRHSEQLERLVEERTLKLKEAQRLATIGETAAMVGHDIRNPLQTVEGAVYIAKEEIKSLSSRTQEIGNIEEMLNTIHEETRYVDKIVTDLQDYARPLTPELEETDIQQLFNNILADSPVLSNIEVSMKVEQDCRKIVVDPTMMKRILTNLITNALQAMPDGGKLTIAASKQQDEVRISVQDSGQGISEENRAKIFQPLFSTKAKGQGLGLAVVKRLVEAHNGLIGFDSELGKGTAFKISIPIAKEAS